MASKRKVRRRTEMTIIALNLRMIRNLHGRLRREALMNSRSLNAEIIDRLERSFEFVTKDEAMRLLHVAAQMGAVVKGHLDGQQATSRPAAQERPAPSQRPPETPTGDGQSPRYRGAYATPEWVGGPGGRTTRRE